MQQKPPHLIIMVDRMFNTDIEIPDKMKALPLDHRGYPIPKFAHIDSEGKPHFDICADDIHVRLVIPGMCFICGQPLGRHRFFIGGPISAKSHYFNDGPSHRECAIFSLKACPFLANRNFTHMTENTKKHIPKKINTAVSTERPPATALIECRYYRVTSVSGNIVIEAGEYEGIEWFCDGELVANPQ